jgi:electron transport complex protein RnfD
VESTAAESRTASTPGDEPVRLTYITPELSTAAPTVLHTGMSVARFYSMHAMGIVFPVTAALLTFGWRALGLVALVLSCCAAATAIWRRVGRRGDQLHYSHVLYLGALLALTLPAHLFSWSVAEPPTPDGTWTLVAAAAFVLVILSWLLGGAGSGRIHPAVLTFLFITVLFRDLLVPHGVLQPHNLFFGDVAQTGPRTQVLPREPWLRTPPNADFDAPYREPASRRLITYTTGTDRPPLASLSLEDLLRDRMPPLEDLIVGGQPAPIGQASAIAVIIGGLFLLYHGLIDYRIPLLTIVSAYVTLLVLPIPLAITTDDVVWRWLPLRDPGAGFAMAATFVHYELLAGPLLLVAFFFATTPACRPMYRRGRAIYGVLIGIAAAALQLYFDVASGPFLAMLAVSLLTPTLDRLFRPRPLV